MRGLHFDIQEVSLIGAGYSVISREASSITGESDGERLRLPNFNNEVGCLEG
jgi:hypothetical protein